MAITIIFLFIYGFTLYIGSGVSYTSNTFKEYNSPNNENILLVNAKGSWASSAVVRFYTKEGNLFKKLIRTPKLDDEIPVSFGILWECDDSVIITGHIVVRNMMKLKKVKERLPDKCDYEVIDKSLHLNLK